MAQEAHMNEPTLAHYVKNLAIAKQALVEAEAAVDDAKRDRRLAEGQLIAALRHRRWRTTSTTYNA